MSKGAIAAAEEHSPFKSTQIKAIWRLARANAVDLNVQVDFKTKMKGNSGRKSKYNQGDEMEAVLAELAESMHRAFSMFLSDEDATFAAENDLDPLSLTE